MFTTNVCNKYLIPKGFLVCAQGADEIINTKIPERIMLTTHYNEKLKFIKRILNEKSKNRI